MTKSWWAVILDNFIQTIVIYLEMRWQQTLCIANQIDYIIFKLCDKSTENIVVIYVVRVHVYLLSQTYLLKLSKMSCEVTRILASKCGI